MNWQPSASLAMLQVRADFLSHIRQFFAVRQMMEVDTPLLCQGVATDPGLQAFAVQVSQKPHFRYLQTSPEYAMKRLIAAGSGPIYYLGKAFRAGEVGRKHNPEFTMLEWYRPAWDHLALIAEVDALMQTLLATQPAKIVTYAALFQAYYGFNPHVVDINTLQTVAISKGWVSQACLPALDRDGWLDLLMSFGIEPCLGQDRPLVVTDYPASQASLAKIRIMTGQPSYAVAERFEFYFKGLELANGYHELCCVDEQATRFQEDLAKRKQLGLSELPIDPYLLAALQSGFPACAGVAVGVDRLLMLKTGEKAIGNVLPFEWERA